MSFTVDQNSVRFKALDDVIVIWIDDYMISNDIYQELRKSDFSVLYTIHSNDFDIYLNYITENLVAGAVVSLIVHSRFIDQLLSISLPNIINIYALGNKYYFRWKNTKVRDVFNQHDPKYISKVLREDFEIYFNRQWSTGISFFQRNTEIQRNFGELSHQNAQFMWYQLLIKILTQMPPSVMSKDDLLQQSFLNYKEDINVRDFKTYESHMYEFKRKYIPEKALEYFTRDSFFYRLMNQACRTSNIDLMFSYRCLIRDIFIQLEKLYIDQKQNCQKPFTVYRGTTITKEELELLQRNIGNLISRHQFLSTSKDNNVASMYAGDMSTTSDEELHILEEIFINPMNCKTVFYADVSEYSYFKDEGEILLSIGSVFRVKSISEIRKGILYKVQLELVDNDEKMIEELHQYLELNIENESTLLTLSSFLLWMGKYDKARYYCDILLTKLAEDDPDRSVICTQIGYICQKMGKFDEALEYLHQSIEKLSNKQKILELSCAYNDRGLIYKCSGDFVKAQNDINKALELRSNEENFTEIERKSLPVFLSHTHENLGILYKDDTTMYQTQGNAYYRQGEYNEALVNFQHAYDIYQSMPYCDPLMIAAAASNIGSTLNVTGNYTAAYPKFEEALNTQRRFAPKHPNIIFALNNMAMVCSNMKDMNAFMNYSQEALRMCREIIGEYHENTAITYLIVAQRLNVEQYDQAMNYFNHVLDIYIQHLRLPYHNNVIGCYIQMGIMERKRGHFEEAHQNFNLANEAYHCSSLPQQHSLLTKLYTQIALTHIEQDQVEAALHAYEQAIKYTPENSHELPKILEDIEVLHERYNIRNSRFQNII
ncbi:hypothetical protein I4U23_016865 [Adineta vaga]|nr:hypothetical protein I4U23_016865 [Adineta vaga]